MDFEFGFLLKVLFDSKRKIYFRDLVPKVYFFTTDFTLFHFKKSMYNPGIRASFLLIGVITERHKIKYGCPLLVPNYILQMKFSSFVISTKVRNHITRATDMISPPSK